MMIETRLTARLIKQIRLANGRVLNVHGHASQDPGWPDVFITHKYWTGWIEFKGPRTPISEYQENILASLYQQVSIWIVRFVEVVGGEKDSSWLMRIETPTTMRTKKQIFLEGGDMRVAIELLKILKQIDQDHA
jgi:hypothetical protein